MKQKRRAFRWWAWFGLISGCQASDPATTSRTVQSAAEPCAGTECCPAGYQVIEGTPGSDDVTGGNTSHCFVLHDAADVVTGGNAPDWLDCGAGDDTCNGGHGDDTVLGGDGDDSLVGDNGNDVLRGGAGRDTMLGGRGDDVLIVASVCEAVPGEIVDGGAGFDTLRTPLSLEQLAELGVELSSIESIVPLADDDPGPECVIPKPGDFGDPAADPTDRLCRVLEQTAAVVRGRVDGITEVFDERPAEGPRRIVELSSVETLLGLPQPIALRLRVMGGTLPDGDSIEVSHTPRFQVGDEYVVFLFSRSWRFAPVPLDFYFRVRELDGNQVLVTETGHVLTGGEGGQLIRRTFAGVESDPAQPVENPLSAQELTQVAPLEQYRVELASIASQCPDALSGVYTPFPVVPWDVMPAARELPEIAF